MKDYVAEFQNKIAEISADCQNINIINAGIMGHGKSSLFNSLLDKEIFAAQDVRTTMENKSVQWSNNVFLIDTPGLEAEESDDAAAYNAYRRANMIVFVHNVKVGELHDKELAAINKIKNLFDNNEFFCKHFCLVLTFKESYSEESITSIRTKTLGDIKTHCGISDFPTFIVSNSRYQKGVAENKNNMIHHSGIPELREFLQKNFSTWQNENSYFRAMRISKEKDDLISQLQKERGKIQNRINSKSDDIKNRQENYLKRVQAAINQRNTEQREADDFKKNNSRVLEILDEERMRLDEKADDAYDRWQNSYYSHWD